MSFSQKRRYFFQIRPLTAFDWPFPIIIHRSTYFWQKYGVPYGITRKERSDIQTKRLLVSSSMKLNFNTPYTDVIIIEFYRNDEDDHPVKITMTMLNVVLIINTLLYLFCLIIAKRKLSSLHRINPSLGLKKLLVLSVFVVCAIRIMTFVGVTCMDVANVRAHYSPSPAWDAKHPFTRGDTNKHAQYNDIDIGDSNEESQDEDYQKFYDASMACLFDLPNTIVVSTYILLTLVWSECFLQSRIHTESAVKWKRRWLLGYTIFNSCLYFTQLVLYILVIVDGSKIVKNILYAAMTGTNCCAVALVAFLYFYLNIQFAGFPPRSTQAKKSLKRISKVMALWTLSRVLWAIVMLIVYVRGIELLHFSSSLLLFLFVFCEIVPIIVMLDYSYVPMIGFDGDGDHLEVSDLVEQEFSNGGDTTRNGTVTSTRRSDEGGGSSGDIDNWLDGFDDQFGFNSGAVEGDQEPLLLQV